MTAYDSYHGIYTYKNPLIYFKIENFDNWQHREISLLKDHLVKTYITKLDEECFEELPIFEPDIEDLIKKEWRLEKYSDLFINMMDLARIHRWCIITLYDEYPYWRVFGPREVDSIEYDGVTPISAKVRWFKSLPLNQQEFDYVEEIVFGDNSPSLFVIFGKPIGKHIGESDLEYLWTLLIELRYINEDIVRNSAKSSGFYFIKMGAMADADDENDMETAMGKANYGNAVAAKFTKIEEIQDIHPQNAEFAISAKVRLMKDLAGACRLPLSFFNSETEKAGLATESRSAEEALVNKKKKYIFSQFKTPIMEIIYKRWGLNLTDVYPFIEEVEEILEDNDIEKEEGNDNKDNNKKKAE